MTSDQTVDAGTTTRIREILADHGRLSADVAALGDTDDLYAAGLTSHASVTVMLACEDAFDMEFEAQYLKKSTFSSVAAIATALEEMGVSGAEAS